MPASIVAFSIINDPAATIEKAVQRLRINEPRLACERWTRRASARACVPQQAVSGVAFEVVPHLLGQIALRLIRWELLQMQPGMRLADSVDDRAPANTDPVPQKHNKPLLLPQRRAGTRPYQLP